MPKALPTLKPAREPSTEELFTMAVQLTSNQMRKVQQIGMDALRQLISDHSPAETPAERAVRIDIRNRAIVLDRRATKDLVPEYKLTRAQLNLIRRTYRA